MGGNGGRGWHLKESYLPLAVVVAQQLLISKFWIRVPLGAGHFLLLTFLPNSPPKFTKTLLNQITHGCASLLGTGKKKNRYLAVLPGETGLLSTEMAKN